MSTTDGVSSWAKFSNDISGAFNVINDIGGKISTTYNTFRDINKKPADSTPPPAGSGQTASLFGWAGNSSSPLVILVIAVIVLSGISIFFKRK